MTTFRDAIVQRHDELFAMLKEFNHDLDAMTIITVGPNPADQMVIAAPLWTKEQTIERLQACIDGLKTGVMKQNVPI